MPAFYLALGVPDTAEGRFDLIVLHVHLLFRRLSGQGAEMQAIGQGVFDRFVTDMDDSLREMGTGDLAVPKRMRVMGEAFYGRAEAYDAALSAQGDDALTAALARNVYGGIPQAEILRAAACPLRAPGRCKSCRTEARRNRAWHCPVSLANGDGG